ncbi:hypothetical protein FRX31_028348, partial [Thalictrum thalictroides]
MGTREGCNEHMYREEKSGRGSLRELIASARADIQAGSRVCARENIQEAAEKSGIVGHMPRAEGEKDGKKRMLQEAAEKSSIVGHMPRAEGEKDGKKRMPHIEEKRQAGQASYKVLTGEQLAENEMLQQRFDDRERWQRESDRNVWQQQTDEVQSILANDYANSPRQPEVNMRDLFEENERWKKVADDYLNKFLDEKKKADSEM